MTPVQTLGRPQPAAQATPRPPAATRRRRQSARITVDTFRGLTILEVILHHASGLALRFLTPGSPEHTAAQIFNRTLHFAVPAFVFLSAVVLTRSLLRRYDLRRYFRRRLVRAVWPYLLWSVLYALWYVWLGQRDAATLRDPAQWWYWLAYGKASFHLYFLLVALQVYAALPLLVLVARHRPRIADTLLVGIPLQLGIYLLNRSVLQLRFPTSSVLWYSLPMLLGVVVGARLKEFPVWWREHRWVLLALLAVVYTMYLPEALKFLRTGQPTPILFDALNWAYTTVIALLLLGLAWSLQSRRSRVQGLVARLGSLSLQVYLLHPAVLQLLERWHAPRGPGAAILLTVALYAAVAAVLPALAAWAIRRTRLSLFLFGR